MLESLSAMEPSKLLVAVVSIIILDLVLSGDNAAVIGMAIRDLPHQMKKKAAAVGALLAIALRVVCTIFATILLTIPYFSVAGGVLLLFITAHLLKSGNEEPGVQTEKSDNHFWKAVGIILVADASMAVDNVLAVAGAAHGEPLLVIFGLIVSIPILMLFSTWLSDLMVRFPIILWIGAAILVRTALDMIIEERTLGLSELIGPTPSLVIPLAGAAAILIFGICKLRRT